MEKKIKENNEIHLEYKKDNSFIYVKYTPGDKSPSVTIAGDTYNYLSEKVQFEIYKRLKEEINNAV